MDEIERKAKLAIDKHQRLLHSKTLELLLGDMIAKDGVHSVRQKLMWYYEHLEEFDND
jgi:hypothetical protein